MKVLTIIAAIILLSLFMGFATITSMRHAYTVAGGFFIGVLFSVFYDYAQKK
jgi:membrane associated rhomboid family serine protease